MYRCRGHEDDTGLDSKGASNDAIGNARGFDARLDQIAAEAVKTTLHTIIDAPNGTTTVFPSSEECNTQQSAK